MAFNDDLSQTEAIKALQGNNYYMINAVSAQTLVKSGKGFLHGVLFEANNISAVQIYDNVISGGSVIAYFDVSSLAAGPWFQLDVNFKNGMVVSSGSSNTILTLSYL